MLILWASSERARKKSLAGDQIRITLTELSTDVVCLVGLAINVVSHRKIAR